MQVSHEIAVCCPGVFEAGHQMIMSGKESPRLKSQRIASRELKSTPRHGGRAVRNLSRTSPQAPHGRGCGVGRARGPGLGRGVGVGRGVPVGVAVGVAVAVAVGLGVVDGVGVGVPPP